MPEYVLPQPFQKQTVTLALKNFNYDTEIAAM